MSACSYVSDLIHATPEFVPACDNYALSLCLPILPGASHRGLCISWASYRGVYFTGRASRRRTSHRHYLTGRISQAVSS